MNNAKWKILIIEDDQLCGRALQLQLEKKGYSCIHLKSGLNFANTLEETQPDLVLLDIMMPDITGIEVLDKIRKIKKSYELPVIMVTAMDETKDVVLALHKGANDYITKPVNVDIAVARVKTQLQVKNLFEASLRGQKKDTVNAMVTTLNHEINNPLAIALGNLTIAFETGNLKRIPKVIAALGRIADIVKKIETLSAQDEVEEVNYTSKISMFKLN